MRGLCFTRDYTEMQRRSKNHRRRLYLQNSNLLHNTESLILTLTFTYNTNAHSYSLRHTRRSLILMSKQGMG